MMAVLFTARRRRPDRKEVYSSDCFNHELPGKNHTRIEKLAATDVEKTECHESFVEKSAG
jgi:hypothetical protein